jgi:hypothetical protein
VNIPIILLDLHEVVLTAIDWRLSQQLAVDGTFTNELRHEAITKGTAV